MNLQEAAVWIDGLFPGEVSIEKVGGFHVASFADDGQFIASTLDFQQVSLGLESNGDDIRVELFAVANRPEGLQELVLAAATMAQDMGLALQPGVVLPGVGKLVQTPLSVQHVLCVAPFPWGGDVPHYREGGRLTLMLQMLPLTDDELVHLRAYGLAQLQQDLVAQQVDILDLQR